MFAINTPSAGRPSLLRSALRRGSLLLLAALAACDRSTEARYDRQPAPQHSIAYLKSLRIGDPTPLTRDIAVRGRIVGNDRFGEFDRLLVVQDGSGGICIAVDIHDSALRYPFGHEVEVRCNGLVLCDYGGKVMLGAGAGDYGPSPIPGERIPLHIRSTAPQPPLAPAPRLRTLAEIDASDVDTYLRIEGVRFSRPGTWCDIDPETHRNRTTEHTLVDAAGRTFTLRVAATCSYAREPVPSGTGSLGCIADRFGGRLSLRPTNYEALFFTPEAPSTAYP